MGELRSRRTWLYLWALWAEITEYWCATEGSGAQVLISKNPNPCLSSHTNSNDPIPPYNQKKKHTFGRTHFVHIQMNNSHQMCQHTSLWKELGVDVFEGVFVDHTTRALLQGKENIIPFDSDAQGILNLPLTWPTPCCKTWKKQYFVLLKKRPP